jgi:hypothetical protein
MPAELGVGSMSSFYFKGETLFANGVDVKRLAREIRKSQLDTNGNPSTSMEDALDVVARGLGARNHFDMRCQAEDPDISSWTHDEVQRLVQESAVSRGMRFPRGLPRKFDQQWQRDAVRLFEQAERARTPGKLEFVALIGSPGSGKTLLANHMCATRGGQVIDVELTFQKGFETNKPNSVLVYDRPAEPPASQRPFMGVLTLWRPEAPSKRTLKMYRELARAGHHRDLIPGDNDDIFTHLRDWVRDNAQVSFVVCFADQSQVEDALRNSSIILTPGSMERSAILNWRRAHVVNLDTMTFVSLDGPGHEMEQETYVSNQ